MLIVYAVGLLLLVLTTAFWALMSAMSSTTTNAGFANTYVLVNMAAPLVPVGTGLAMMAAWPGA